MYRKSLELDPDSPAAHFNLASTLARSGEFAEAEQHFRAVLEKDPGSQAYTGLGIVLWQQGRQDEGIANMRAAIAADPENATAHDQLGKMLLQKGELDEARKELAQAKALNPSLGDVQ
jgi:Flp pilus assembly protein TadD